MKKILILLGSLISIGANAQTWNDKSLEISTKANNNWSVIENRVLNKAVFDKKTDAFLKVESVILTNNNRLVTMYCNDKIIAETVVTLQSNPTLWGNCKHIEYKSQVKNILGELN